MMKIKTLMIYLLAAAVLYLATACAANKADPPAPEVTPSENTDYKILERPGVELSFDSKSPGGSYSMICSL